MNFSKKFLLLWVIFALLDPDLDPDSEYGSGSTDPVEYGSNPDLDPIRIHNPEKILVYFKDLQKMIIT
jgi:hypothetical protein